MRRVILIRSLVAVALVALLAPVAASANVNLRGVDATGYPTLRATIVSPVASSQPPTLTENGQRVLDLTTQNLASAKSVVIAVDRSRSMAGRQLDDAVAAAGCVEQLRHMRRQRDDAARGLGQRHGVAGIVDDGDGCVGGAGQ